jgi:LuxR family maltose regulon positive regulatory protein
VALLSEALSRAAGGGLVRVFADTLPEVVDLVRRNAQACTGSAVSAAFVGRVLAAAENTPSGEVQVTRATGNALLTPKEDWVLRLLAGGLPNKRIAVEMDLSTETVKWHVRKVMAKLNASSREHAVHRARMLGLLQ